VCRRVRHTLVAKSPEVASYIEALREKFYGALEIAMDALLNDLRNPNSKTRAGLAYEMLKSGGVIPSERERALSRCATVDGACKPRRWREKSNGQVD
jgi:hypothetical protein